MTKKRIIKWQVLNEHANYICNKLNTENEKSGTILFKNKNFKSSKVLFTEEGNSKNVNINIKRDHLLSFHTHPIGAYKNAKCIYGHPSGEDLREFIILASKGVLNNAVFSVEGMYLVQIHPKFVNFFLSLDKIERQNILTHVFEYFRKFHYFRSIEYCSSNNTYTPREFIKKCNDFKIKNIYTDKIFSILWYYTNNFLEYENDPHERWKLIQSETIPIEYKNNIVLHFKFLELEDNERTISNVLREIA